MNDPRKQEFELRITVEVVKTDTYTNTTIASETSKLLGVLSDIEARAETVVPRVVDMVLMNARRTMHARVDEYLKWKESESE